MNIQLLRAMGGLGGGGGTYNYSKYALQFDGTVNSVCTIISEDFNFSGGKAFSISGWVNTSAIPTTGQFTTIFSRSISTQIAYACRVVRTNATTVTCELRIYAASMASSTICQFTINTTPIGFHHFAVSVDETNKAAGVNMYYDGMLRNKTTAADTLTAMYTGSIQNTIGFYYTTQYASGLVDDVLVCDKALTATEVQEIYDLPRYSDYTDLSFNVNVVGYWGFDNNLTDSKGHTGTCPAPVYAQSTSVAYLSTTGNNTTAELGSKTVKYETIDGALLAFIAAKIRYPYFVFESGDFAKHTDSNLIHNISYKGVLPQYDSLTLPTKLQNGTVIKGGSRFNSIAKVEAIDVGFDAGSEWCDAFNSGNALDGLNINGQTASDINLKNVVTLCKATNSLFHGVIFENMRGVKLENVKAFYGTHGVVIKCQNVTAKNIESYANNSDGLIIKKDTGSGEVKNINVDGFKYRNVGNTATANVWITNDQVGALSDVSILNCDLDATSDLRLDAGTLENIVVKDTNGQDILP